MPSSGPPRVERSRSRVGRPASHFWANSGAHAVARLHAGHPVADLHHLAGAVRAGDERQLLLRVVLPLDGEQVAEIERGGAQPHQDLPRPRPRVGPLDQGQVVEAEAAADLDRAHGVSSRGVLDGGAGASSRPARGRPASASLPASQPMPSPWRPSLGMMWKCTCITTWCASEPLFWRTL